MMVLFHSLSIYFLVNAVVYVSYGQLYKPLDYMREKMKKIFLGMMLCSFVACQIRAMDGTPDPAFGGGTGFVDNPTGVFASDVAVQADGKIVVLGENLSGNDQIARYDSAGNLDLTFNGTGIVTNTIGFSSALLIQPDGKIVIGGADGSGSNFQLVRYNPNGALDLSFGSGGYATGPAGSAQGIVLQTDSKIVATGTDAAGNFRTVRFEADGSSFITFQAGPDGFATDVAVQADGKIVAGGISNIADYQLVRYDTNGSLDGSFGVGGIATGPQGFPTGIVIQSDGKVVMGGSTFTANFQVARFDTTGFLDLTFGMAASGFFIGPPGSSNDTVLQGDEKAVLVGNNPGGFQFQSVRYANNGQMLDGGFGTAGIATGPAGIGLGAALQEDGKLIVVGREPTLNFFRVARYLNSPVLVPTQILVPLTGSTFPAGNVVFSGTAQNPSNVYIFLDGVLIGGVATDPLGTDTWTFTATIAASGVHTVQAVSVYEDGNVNIASNIISITIEGVEPVSNFKGTVTCNKFLNAKECNLQATFSPSPSPNVVFYRIFRNGVLLTQIPASSPLTFTLCVATSFCDDCCTNSAFKNITIVAVNQDGMESEAVPLEVLCA